MSTTNANALREALAPYVASARRTGGRRIKVAVGQPTDSTKQESEPRTIYTATHDIRTWARENGDEVADQGRIAKTVIDGIPLISPAPQQGNDALSTSMHL
ncbi:histone-like nucleoid-structuring protein Lsr2 [Amycolatopsis sp. NPDC049688]|uniref:Lsr2 family DNA-binding protein n=1 Tax=Amycolatopsis sp. NPDC049688 TaxID=3154733 RepID=UPI003413E263